jgi:hypothetical protein
VVTALWAVAPGKYKSPPPYVAAELQAGDVIRGRLVYVELEPAMEPMELVLVAEDM